MTWDSKKPTQEQAQRTYENAAEARRTTLVDSSGSNLSSSNPLSITDGFNIPEFDYLTLTYVAAGNGAGEIETAIFKTGGAGGSTVATLTLTYGVNNEIATVTKS